MSARATRSVVDTLDVLDERAVKAIARAMGEELRRARDAREWTREELVTMLPSGICSRTLLSYEHGTRQMTVMRYIEICRVLGVNAPRVLSVALHRARVDIANFSLWVDLRALVADNAAAFRVVVSWARNKLVEHPGGIVEVVPAGVRELATVAGCTHHDLARYFARFIPKRYQITENEEDQSLIRS